LPMYRSVNDSSLERDIKKLRPETLAAINRILVAHACGQGIEKGQKVRTDCTGVESLIHEPKDSWLLYDSVRVLTRLTKQAKNLLPTISMTDRHVVDTNKGKLKGPNGTKWSSMERREVRNPL
ncbi:MAG: hypothetical protein MJE77_10995, partial [Proteobacteria bacterium]|nr:hypothetical protein [Pseudomonadota bacterium]